MEYIVYYEHCFKYKSPRILFRSQMEIMYNCIIQQEQNSLKETPCPFVVIFTITIKDDRFIASSSSNDLGDLRTAD